MGTSRVVVDTNVIVGAFLRQTGENRRVIRACLEGRVLPLMGDRLYFEYEEVLSRAGLFGNCPLSEEERRELLDAFLSVCEWVSIYYTWRPNLPDEGDNHIVELAVSGGASAIVTNNISDFRRTDLKFPAIRILRPKDLLQSLL